jgi:hypothetical protein
MLPSATPKPPGNIDSPPAIDADDKIKVAENKDNFIL